MSNSSNSSTEPNKSFLYDWWNNNQKWQSKLHRQAAHKALDIPDDEMIQANRIGIGGKELAIILASVLGAGSMGAFATSSLLQKETPVQPSSPIDSEYEVRFYDREGKPIEIEPLPKS